MRRLIPFLVLTIFILIFSRTNAQIIWQENFDSYVSDSIIDPQSTQWVGWGNAVTSAYVSDDTSSSPNNSLKIWEATVPGSSTDLSDILHVFPNYTTGRYMLKFKVFVPSSVNGTEAAAYWNIQHIIDPLTNIGMEWAFDVQIRTMSSPTLSSIAVGGNEYFFQAKYDEWVEVIHIFDLDRDKHDFFYDGKLVTSQPFSYQTLTTTGGTLQLAGIDIFANCDGIVNCTEVGYFDDFIFKDAPLPPNDAAVLSIDSPLAVCAGNYNVAATIGNFGSNQINQLTINWEVNGVSQTPVSYTQLLDTLKGSNPSTALVSLGSAAFQAGTNTITIYTSSPNSMTDTVNYNDTIQIQLQTGVPPMDVSVVNVSANSATVAVNGGTNNMDYEYGPANFTLGTGTMVTTSNNPFTITGLTPSTAYEVYVRNNCGATTSTWAGPVAFLTPCLALTAPYSENFDSAPTSSPFAGISCWTISGPGANDIHLVDDADGTNIGAIPTLSNAVEFNEGIFQSDTSLLVSPPFSDIGTAKNRIRFQAAFENTQPDENMYVGLMTNPSDPSTFMPIDTIDATDIGGGYGFDEVIIPLTDTASYGNSQFIAFAHGDGNGNYEVYIDDFHYEPIPSCIKPSNLTVSNITADSALLGWFENNIATEWIIEYGTSGFTQGTGIMDTVSSNPVSIQNLTPNTQYEFYVRSVCGRNDSSYWSGPFNFKTLCSPFTATYFNDFESEALDIPPSCWFAKATYSASWVEVEDFTGTAAPYAGSQALYLYGSSGNSTTDTLIAISPTYSDLIAGDKQVRFYANSDDPASQLIIGTMPNPLGNVMNVIDTITLQVADVYQEVIVEINAANGYNGTDQYIYLQHSLGGSADYVRIDDFYYELIPSCKKPDSLTATNIISNSAQLSWFEANVANKWEIEYGTSNFNLGSGTSTIVNSNPYNLTGLTPETDYDFYVRTICGRGDSSFWAGPFSFSTPCIPTNMPFEEHFDTNTTPTCWVESGDTEWDYSTASDYGAADADEHTGNSGNAAWMDGSTNSYGEVSSLTSPLITFPLTATPGLSYWVFYNNTNDAARNLLEVEFFDGSNWHLVDTLRHNLGADWVNRRINLSAYTVTGPVQFRFTVTGTNAGGIPQYNDILLDDISLFEIYPNDAGVTEIISPLRFCPGTVSPTVEVENFGNNTISSLNIITSVNGVLDTVPLTGTMLPGEKQNITLNPKTFAAGTTYNIKVYTSMPNAVNDTLNLNDTLSLKDFKTGLAGNYTIDPSLPASILNYQSMGDAVNDLTAYGVCGSVNFDVAPGTYNEALVFGEIIGSSSTSTVTFDGIDSSLVTLIDNGQNTATVILDGTDYLTLKNMRIENTGTSNAAVLLGPGSDHNEISNSVLRVASSTSSSSIVLVFSGSATSTTSTGTNASYNLVKNNRIINGYYGIKMYSASDDPSTSNQIINNKIDSAYYYGMYSYYTDFLEIIGNEFDAVTSGNINADGVYIYYSANSKLVGNKIHANDYGVYFYSYNIPSASTVQRNYEIVNNMIISESDYGIYTYYLDAVDIYHNTVVVRGSSPALRIGATSTKPSTVDLRNNILIGGSDPALETLEPAASMFTGLDNNIYYSSGTTLVDIDGTDYSDLASLQAAYPTYNVGSIEGLPLFSAVDDLHIVGSLPNNAGDNNVGVNVDIDGDTRPIGNDLVVDIGADEFELFSDDAGVTKIVSPLGRICPGSIAVGVGVRNFGINDIDSVEVVSIINGVSDTTKYNTTIPVGQSATVFLNPYTFASGSSYDLQFYTNLPNGVNDTINSNDTLSLMDMTTGLAGNYTIDTALPASLTNFHTFSNAISTLNTNGVCGPVTFQVAAAVYNEAVVFGKIDGASNANTITFDGINSSLVSLVDSGQNAATVILDGTNYVILKNMSIENTGTTNAAVLFGPESDHNEVSNSVLKVAQSTTSSSIPVVFSGSASSTTATGANASYNLIKDNHIINGYYGIRMYSATGDPCTYNRIVDNVIDSAYYYGMYTYYTDSLEIIGNKVDAVSAGNTNADGIYIYYSANSVLSGNNIHANDYGVYFYSYNIPSASVQERRYEISNNMIISESDYGLYSYYLDSVNIYHNTVEVRGSSPALRIYSTASKPSIVDLRNNILIGGADPALETVEPASSMFLNFDNNIYYSTGTVLVDIDGNDYADLASLQSSLPGYNMESIEGLPMFAGIDDLHVVGPLPNNEGDNSVGIAVDIDGDVRPIGNDTIVDIGADEFEIATKDVIALGLAQPIETLYKCYSSSENVVISFSNFGLDSLDFSTDSVTVTVDVTGATTQTLTYTVNNNSLNAGLKFAPLDTVNVPVGTINMSAVGNYYFDLSLSMTYDGDTANNVILDTIRVQSPFGGFVTGPDTICAGDSVMLSLTDYIGGDIQWQSATAGTFTNLSGAVTPEFYVNPLVTTQYRAMLCGTAISDTLTIEAVSLSQPIAFDSTLIITCGDTGTVALVATSSNPNAVFEWYDVPTGGTALTAGGNIVSISPNGDTLFYRGTNVDTNNPAIDTFYVQEVVKIVGNAASSILITEIDVSGPDALEIQNVSSQNIDVTGWKVAVSDDYNVITDVNTIVQTLSGTLSPNQILTWTDAAGPTDWGNNILWNPSSGGWAMIIDDLGNVVDFVAWEWTQADIYSFNANIGGYNITLGVDEWTGNGVTASNNIIERIGKNDNNDSADFNNGTSSTIGTANPSLVLPFPVGNCFSSRDTAIAIIDCLVNIEEAENNFTNISIYPNPSQGIFNIVGNNVKEKVEISIYNTSGKLVYRSNDKLSNSFTERIDISNFAKGLYFVKLQSKSSMEMKKIVVQ